MTNITAAILIIVTTNWASIGEFKDKNNYTYDVQESHYLTNHTLIFDESGKKYEYVFKSFEGPKISEQRVLKSGPINGYFDLPGSIYRWPTNIYNWQCYSNIYFTNSIQL